MCTSNVCDSIHIPKPAIFNEGRNILDRTYGKYGKEKKKRQENPQASIYMYLFTNRHTNPKGRSCDAVSLLMRTSVFS